MANTICITTKLSRDKSKIWHYFEWGKAAGQRKASGIYTWAKPKGQAQKNYNIEALAILEAKRSQLTLEKQAVASGYVPTHRIKDNFFDYYEEFVTNNERKGNRSLSASLMAFRNFWGKERIAAGDITENLCERFRAYLLDKLKGETPGDYFMRFKRVIKAATKEGYFIENPAEEVKTKVHPSGEKDILESAEWIKLMNTPCPNNEVRRAAIFSLYTGFRWCDVEPLYWSDVSNKGVKKIQNKTGFKVEVPIHEVARVALGDRGNDTDKVFDLPTQDGANDALGKWVLSAGIKKHITWGGLRNSMSVLLQDAGVAVQTVAGLLGHTTSKYVHKTYQRYRRNAGEDAINKLPNN